jgi:hypothetical protein
MKRLYASGLAALLLSLGIAGCGGGSSDSGILGVKLTDAPADFEAVYVTVDHVDVHRADESNESNSSWITVADVNGTYDLLTLQDGNLTQIGVATIPAAKYTQMRLYLAAESNDTALHPYGNYVVIDGNATELDVPSMFVRENHNFVMAPDGNMTMTIDFDADRSIHSTGNGGWTLKPVLHVDTK